MREERLTRTLSNGISNIRDVVERRFFLIIIITTGDLNKMFSYSNQSRYV